MARDNSPKERQRKQLERKTGRRAPYDRVLIVSEGSKTEPHYFKEIRAEYRLHTANVAVYPSELGTAPIQVVRYAEQLFADGDRHKDIPRRAFERVYAVFDRDDHESYYDALNLAKSLDRKLRNELREPVRFFAVASVPCFELWLLLHFEDIKSALHRDEALRRLKKHLPGYEKGTRGVFALTRDRCEIATARATALAARSSAHDAPEPFTAVGELVALLTSLGQTRSGQTDELAGTVAPAAPARSRGAAAMRQRLGWPAAVEEAVNANLETNLDDFVDG